MYETFSDQIIWSVILVVKYLSGAYSVLLADDRVTNQNCCVHINTIICREIKNCVQHIVYGLFLNQKYNIFWMLASLR